ncbi:S-adenosylmethionine:tRNA ribosyltransferase-isomerase [Rossellomorea vietnamensis]|uniref:S-adenosylmethionine:tRNA ribosyltransferase-isomerase n=1 Tax=Rossellomorea vietnamensis TaxID=218284 RepID=UPI001E549ADD|nr:S-adenosylmethionine:tRNA ribosyltransferase-isomerase [Rossellomorea vietnamensis]MCC5803415.1 S-adenosylmethionine:tRNA ribosyltransferase-isomerase [Rossellomorea vietnamensis]
MNGRSFQIPSRLNATTPIELQGLERDDVKLMVLDREYAKCEHTVFKNLPDFLHEGDVLVFNNSRTLPASLKGKQGNRNVLVRLSRKRSRNTWDALILGDVHQAGEPIDFPGGVSGHIKGPGSETPLVQLEFNKGDSELMDFIFKNGEPIRYEYISEPWPLDYYQNVYGSVPGSVEMASAGRAFTWRLLQALKEKGVGIVFILLHAGLSYYGNDRWPMPNHHPEDYRVSPEAVNEILHAKNRGKRVIAVGTTVVRALETVMTQHGQLQPAEGVTNLYISGDTSLQIVDGLITGLHEPEASHLNLLKAFMSEDKLRHAYQTALAKNYKWHEFGDMNIIL